MAIIRECSRIGCACSLVPRLFALVVPGIFCKHTEGVPELCMEVPGRSFHSAAQEQQPKKKAGTKSGAAMAAPAATVPTPLGCHGHSYSVTQTEALKNLPRTNFKL